MLSDDEDFTKSPNSSTARKKSNYDYLHAHMDYYDVEASAIRRKLQSKTEALRILRKELEKFRTERDQYKLMAETLQLRYSTRSAIDLTSNQNFGTSSVADLVREQQEQNLRLATQVEKLKQKVIDLQGDIELLREKAEENLSRNKLQNSNVQHLKEFHMWKDERRKFLKHLEDSRKAYVQLQLDFKTLIEEREEIINDRDAYKCKMHRMSHELKSALKVNEKHPQLLDVDSIIFENKYLTERVKVLEDEAKISKEAEKKFKSLLESKRKRGIIKLSTQTNEENYLSPKQVKNILESGIQLPKNLNNNFELRTFCANLSEQLEDKNTIISHKNRTTRLLGEKITELQKTIQNLTGFNSPTNAIDSPAQILLDGYVPSIVDKDVDINIVDVNDKLLNGIKPKTRNITEDSGTMSSEHDSNKTSNGCAASEDALSSLSTESGRSIISSEYGTETVSRTAVPLDYYDNISTTYDIDRLRVKPLIPTSIARERARDLKGLPAHLAEMVNKALYDLDMYDMQCKYVDIREMNREEKDRQDYVADEQPMAIEDVYMDNTIANIDNNIDLTTVSSEEEGAIYLNRATFKTEVHMSTEEQEVSD